MPKKSESFAAIAGDPMMERDAMDPAHATFTARFNHTPSRFPAMRKDLRIESHDIIRWKRPGMIEDHKAWAVDKSATSMGFLTDVQSAPQVGDTLNIRFRIHGDWQSAEQTVRIARTQLTPSRDLVMVGCTIEP